MSKQIQEPLLTPDDSRFVMFPIQDEEVWNMYKKQVDCFWRAEEVDLSKDLTHWNNLLNKDEKHFITMILAFFASSDGIVLENLGVRFMTGTKCRSRAFYGFQIAMENIHSQMYSQLIETYVQDREEKSKMFNALENFECIEKADWAKNGLG